MYMLKQCGAVFAMVLILVPSVLLAQSESSPTEQVRPELQSGELLECADYFAPNRITTSMVAEPASVAPNETVTFSGVVQNVHTYPIVDATVHVKIFKRNEVTAVQGYGDIVVFQEPVVTGVVVPSAGTMAVSYDWVVPRNAEAGQYYAAFYITAVGTDFAVMGVTVANDNLFNQVDFTVVHDGYIPTVYFDRATIRVNSERYFTGTVLNSISSEPTTIAVSLVNPSSESKQITLQWNEYTFRTANAEPLRNSENSFITLAPNETKLVTYTTSLERVADGLSYVTATMQDQFVAQYLNVDLFRSENGVKAPYIQIASPSQFPFRADESVTLFTCIESPASNNPANITTIITTLTDEAGEIIHEYKHEGSLGAFTQGFGDSFVPIKDYTYARLEVEVQYFGIPVLQSAVVYDCSADGFGNCETTDVALTADEKTPQSFLIPFMLLTIVLLGIIGAVAFRRKKAVGNIPRPPSSIELSSIIFFLILGTLSVLVPTAEAQTCTPVTTWDCWVSELVEGPYAPSASYSCVPDGEDYSSACGTWWGWMTSESQTHNNVTTIPAGYGTCGSLCPATPPPPPPPPPPSCTCNAAQCEGPNLVSRDSCTNRWEDGCGVQWNHSSCVAPPPPPLSAGAGTLTASGCTIPVGASTCNSSVTWSVPDWNPNTGNFYSFTRRIYSSVETAVVGLSGTRALALTFGGNTVVLSELPVSPAIVMLTMEPQYLTASANTVCAAGSNWNGSICVASAPATGNISGVGCVIPVGQSTCTGRATWTIANATSPNVYNNNTGIQFSSSPSGSNIAVTLVPGPNNIAIRNGSTPIGYSVPLTAACASGTTWNGSVCAANSPPPPPAATAFVTGNLCTIPAGQGTCTTTVSWTISNAPSPNLYNLNTGTVLSNQANGTNLNVTMPFGSYTIEARNANSRIADAFLIALCVTGTSWNGSTCSATPPSCTPDGMTPISTACCSGTSHIAVSCFGYSFFDAGSPSCIGMTMCGLPPGPPPSPTISGNGCTVAAGASTCNGTLTWNISNPASPNVRNTSTNTQYSTNASGNNQAVAISFGDNTVVARNGTTVVASTILRASCASGTSWNGSVCVAAPPVSCASNTTSNSCSAASGCIWWDSIECGGPTSVGNATCSGCGTLTIPPIVIPPPPSVTYNLSGSECTIPSGASTCSGSVTWSTTNFTSPNVRNTNTGTQYSTNPSGTNQPASLTYGSNVIALRDGSNTLQTTTLITACAAGSAWNGSSCAVAVPPSTITLQVDGSDGPLPVPYNQAVNVTWTGTNVTNCNLSMPGSIQTVNGLSGNRSAIAQFTYTYLIDCGAGVTDSVQVTVAPPPAVTTSLDVSVSGGPWESSDRSITELDTLSFRWGSTNASACSFNGTGVALSTSGQTVAPPAAGGSRTYTLNCTGAGTPSSKNIAINTIALPNLVVTAINTNHSTNNYNPATGAYDWLRVNVNNANRGGGGTTIDVPYEVRIENTSHPVGHADTETASHRALNPDPDSVNVPIVFTNAPGGIPFGHYDIFAHVDHSMQIPETNDSDNTADLRGQLIPPPAPDLDVSVSPSRVIRSGTPVTLSWNTVVYYPTLRCTLTGPFLSSYGGEYTFEPHAMGANGSGSVTTDEITATSDYFLSCIETITGTRFDAPGPTRIETVGTVEEI